jgi:hypothetical protein
MTRSRSGRTQITTRGESSAPSLHTRGGLANHGLLGEGRSCARWPSSFAGTRPYRRTMEGAHVGIYGAHGRWDTCPRTSHRQRHATRASPRRLGRSGSALGISGVRVGLEIRTW